MQPLQVLALVNTVGHGRAGGQRHRHAHSSGREQGGQRQGQQGAAPQAGLAAAHSEVTEHRCQCEPSSILYSIYTSNN